MMAKKTFKREVAVFQVILHWLLVAFICWLEYDDSLRDTTDLIGLATGLALWVYGFAGAAFSLDSYSKQVLAARAQHD